MTKSSVKKTVADIARHTKILLSGFKRTLFGALTAGLFAVSIYGLSSIPNEDGYVAVLDFVAAIATLTVALGCMYLQGTFRKTVSEKRGGGK